MTAPTITTPHIEVDPQVLDEGFAKHDFPLRHNLVSHPLFELDALAELADSMPEGQVEHNLGDLPEALTDDNRPQADLTPGEIARGIETNRCWMVLKRVEHDPRYKALLHDLLGPVVDRVAPREGGATRMEGYVVLSAPNIHEPILGGTAQPGPEVGQNSGHLPSMYWPRQLAGTIFRDLEFRRKSSDFLCHQRGVRNVAATPLISVNPKANR